jgi:hypothetical protein
LESAINAVHQGRVNVKVIMVVDEGRETGKAEEMFYAL